MAVAVHKLTGGDIPVSFRGPSVHAVWLVVRNNEAVKVCASEEEANALAAYLEEQQIESEYQHALELAEDEGEDFEPDPPRYSGPRMG